MSLGFYTDCPPRWSLHSQLSGLHHFTSLHSNSLSGLVWFSGSSLSGSQLCNRSQCWQPLHNLMLRRTVWSYNYRRVALPGNNSVIYFLSPRQATAQHHKSTLHTPSRLPQLNIIKTEIKYSLHSVCLILPQVRAGGRAGFELFLFVCS